MYGIQCLQQTGNSISIDSLGTWAFRTQFGTQVRFCYAEFVFNFSSIDVHVDTYIFLMLHRYGTKSTSFTRNGIVQVTAIDFTKIHIVLGSYLTQETVQQLVGIGTILADVITRVTTCQTLDCYVEEKIILWSINFFVSKFSSSVCTTSTTDEEFAFVFRIEVNQDVTIHKTFLQSESTSQTGFFVYGKETFDRTMFDVLGSQYSQLSSHTNTIVGTQCGSLCLQPFAIDVSFNRVIQEIVCRIAVLFAYHINVRLENHGLQVFLTRSCRLLHQDVTSFILFRFQALFFGKIHQISDNLLLLLRRAWHLTYFRKIMKYRCRFKFYFFHTSIY